MGGSHRKRLEDRQTPDNVNKILGYYCEGMEYEFIQHRCGISRNSVLGFVKKNGYPARPSRKMDCLPTKERQAWIDTAKAHHAARIAAQKGSQDAAAHR